MTEGQKYYAKICVLFSTPLNQHGFFFSLPPVKWLFVKVGLKLIIIKLMVGFEITPQSKTI